MPSTSTSENGRLATGRDLRRAPRRAASAQSEGVGSADSTTTVSLATELAAYVGGFVAGEGCFVSTEGGTRFAFAVGLSASDDVSCELLLAFFGVGHIHRSARRQAHQDDAACFTIGALPELIQVVVPFMDEHLPGSYKRLQYEAWRSELLEYWEHRAKRVRPCTVEGCQQPRRAKGLCRSHYYDAYHQ